MQFLYKHLRNSFVYLIQSCLGIIALILYTTNAVLGFVVILSLSILQWMLFPKGRLHCRNIMEKLPTYWVQINTVIQKLTIPYVNWKTYFKLPIDVHALSLDKWYLLISNHKSWVDILVLQRIFNKKIPPIKFFVKNGLVWALPFIGWVCWLLGFPTVRRYSSKQILENASLKKQNRQVARAACKRYQKYPTTIANFVEGGCFSRNKQLQQKSPYYGLLTPHTGGTAVVLSALDNYCHHVLNVTIIYNPDKCNLWHFICGRISEICVYVEVLPVPSYLRGDYENDPLFRKVIQQWMHALWSEKDRLIRNNFNQGEWVQWIE